MTVHSFLGSLLIVTYINSVTHWAFYFVDYAFRPAFTFLDTFSIDFWWKRTVINHWWFNDFFQNKCHHKYPHVCIIYWFFPNIYARIYCYLWISSSLQRLPCGTCVVWNSIPPWVWLFSHYFGNINTLFRVVGF